jgi:DNA phosphorothioation-dependent restriction protein DptG
MKNNFKDISIKTIGEKNLIKHFYPFTREDYVPNKQYSFNEIIGLLIAYINSEQLKVFDFQLFKEKCINSFSAYIDDEEETINLLENLYFKEEKINLDSLLIKQIFLPSTKSKKVFEIFKDMINTKKINVDFESNSNFLEQIITNQFKKEFKSDNLKTSNTSYLPFLEKFFRKDLEFLNTNKHYFSKNLESFLELYLFIYCSQLALNLQPVKNALSVPSSQELYFILNYETASNERKKVSEFGYKKLYDKAKYIFPYMSLLSIFSKVLKNDNLKLYELEDIFNNDDIELMRNFHIKFREAKKLPSNESLLPETNIKEVLTNIFNSTFEQFLEYNFQGKKNIVERKGPLNKVHKAFETQIAAPFLVNRKRAGKVLVMDQDRLILLTNIAIGEKKKVRFQELLTEFNNRGIYFDIKSQVELINVFEKVGNIERKSDSGDAVYVKTTI